MEDTGIVGLLFPLVEWAATNYSKEELSVYGLVCDFVGALLLAVPMLGLMDMILKVSDYVWRLLITAPQHRFGKLLSTAVVSFLGIFIMAFILKAMGSISIPTNYAPVAFWVLCFIAMFLSMVFVTGIGLIFKAASKQEYASKCIGYIGVLMLVGGFYLQTAVNFAS